MPRAGQEICKLYLISPPVIDLSQFKIQLQETFSGRDVGAFQLRLKEADDASILQAGRELLPICRAHGAAFIVNDRPDLAAKISADGVHLGQEDLETMPIAQARAIVGEEAIIGISAHASKHLAMEAGEQGADYVAFGAFYPTATKPAEKLAKWGVPMPEILKWWSTYMVLPCVAIGGITPSNCKALVESGADFIAAVTSVWNHPDGPAAAVRAFNHVFSETAAE